MGFYPMVEFTVCDSGAGPAGEIPAGKSCVGAIPKT